VPTKTEIPLSLSREEFEKMHGIKIAKPFSADKVEAALKALHVNPVYGRNEVTAVFDLDRPIEEVEHEIVRLAFKYPDADICMSVDEGKKNDNLIITTSITI